jgi:hypothetical protein
MSSSGKADTGKAGGLRLGAEDAADLDVISAVLQDSVTRVGDLALLPGKRRFAMVVNRFRWEKETGGSASHERVRAGLHVENVMRAQVRNILLDRPDGILNLLAVHFEEFEAPSGVVKLSFSGGAEIALHVEALDVHLSDLTVGWETSNLPAHDLDDSGPKNNGRS